MHNEAEQNEYIVWPAYTDTSLKTSPDIKESVKNQTVQFEYIVWPTQTDISVEHLLMSILLSVQMEPKY